MSLQLLGSAAMITAALALSTVGSPEQQRPGIEVHRDTRSELASVNLAEAVAVAVAQTQAEGPDGLPAQWCGDETTTEGTANASSPESAARFKVVYAYAADRPNRFAGFQDALQANVAITERFLSAQSGGTKAIRFDMGTRCGPEYVDLQVVALPGPRADYAGNFNAVATAVSRALGTSAGPRNTVILADSLSSMGVEFGLGETIMGDAGEQPGAANPHNRGGLRSVLFTRDGDDAPGAARGGWWPEGFLHEITHNLGGVQWGAPHSTAPAAGDQGSRYGHCWQGADVMCYVEDEGASHAMQYDCAPIDGTIAQSFDCGRDDYYNPAPAADSYLATHWNTYDSTFMSPCLAIAPACGGGELWIPAPPVATTAPSISGRPRRGAPLQTHDGTWLNAPDTYIRTWQRQTPKHRWVNVSSGSAPSYAPSERDLGRRLRVVVIAENADGVTASTSAPTAPIASIGIIRAASSRQHKGTR